MDHRTFFAVMFPVLAPLTLWLLRVVARLIVGALRLVLRLIRGYLAHVRLLAHR